MHGINGKCLKDFSVKQTGLEVVDWICLAQNREQWQALVTMVMNL
jgi:hypothetical protein